MKRVDLIRHLEAHGCRLLREGGSHSVFVHQAARKVTTVPRHREIKEFLARKICRDLEIPQPERSRTSVTKRSEDIGNTERYAGACAPGRRSDLRSATPPRGTARAARGRTTPAAAKSQEETRATLEEMSQSMAAAADRIKEDMLSQVNAWTIAGLEDRAREDESR